MENLENSGVPGSDDTGDLLGEADQSAELVSLAPVNDLHSSNEFCTIEGEHNPRPVRNLTLSTRGKESKIHELRLNIGKKINAHLRNLKKTQVTISNGVLLDDLVLLCNDTKEQAKCVSTLYDELYSLVDNKMNEQIQNMYESYNSAITAFTATIEGEIEKLEDEKEREMEAEAKLFNELMEEMNHTQFGPPLIIKERVPPSPGPVELASSPLRTTGVSRTDRDIVSGLRPTEYETGARTVAPSKALEELSSSHVSIPTTTGTDSELSVVKQLAESLAAAINSSKKSVEPAVFDGNVLEFNDWEVDLDTYLRKEHIEGKERLRHLKKFLGGEAMKCVRGHFVTNTNEAYLDARETLKDRYGNETKIARSFRKRLENWQKIQPRDGKALREYSDFLSHLRSAMVSIKSLKVLNDELENEKMVEKIPDWLRRKWAHVVAKTQRQEDRYPSFFEYSNFIKEEAEVMALPISQIQVSREKETRPPRQVSRDSGSHPQRTARSYLATTVDKDDGCLFCSLTNHSTRNCRKLQGKAKDEKTRFITQNGLCFKCLTKGHRSKGCTARLECLTCHKPHSTVNHNPEWKENKDRKPADADYNNPRAANGTTQTDTRNSEDNRNITIEAQTKTDTPQKNIHVNSIGLSQNLTSMAIPVYVSADTGRELLVYALLDNQSDACFISKEVIQALKPKVTEVETVKICTINGNCEKEVNRYDDIILRGFSTDIHAVLSAYEQQSIDVDRTQLPTPDKARRVEHLHSVAEKMPPLLDIPIGLLLGMDHPELIQPLEIRPAPNHTLGKPFGVRTSLGWTMCGGSSNRNVKNRNVYKVELKADTQILKLLERDFCDIDDGGPPRSQDDIKFLGILEASTKQNEQGNYVLPLPFKCTPELPNNKAQANKRLQQLLTKLRGEESYRQEYTKFMNNLIIGGHAEEVPAEELKVQGNVWYMPHFGVRHPRKQKLRVVFDASAKYKGISLNDVLLSGPEHMNSLLGILLRFRKEPVAFSCDIEQMFYNFQVVPEHRNFLRYLWTDDNLSTIKEYRMKVHLFGATSSPGVATFGLRKLADDYKQQSPEAARFLKEDFYVDDGVTSVATPEIAKDMINQAVAICRRGNIRLHKFICNSPEVLATVDESERKITKSTEIFGNKLTSERTLGMEWNTELDTFQYTTPPSDKPVTKRGLLSTIAQIYDPIGLVSPLILKGKRILQRVTSSELSWDQLLEPLDRQEWEKWRIDTTTLPDLQIPRCYKPKGTVISTELHHFSDASLYGYGACSYIRHTTDAGTVSCNLVIAKARVAPLKKVTIPRLELQGAVTAVRLASTLRRELKIQIDKEIFWTDSKIVLGYIANETKQFHIYVANRVSEIKKSTQTEQWNYVPTNENPADLASRGATAKDIIEKPMWLQGPNFLKQEDISGYLKLRNSFERSVSDDDPEVRKLKAYATSASPTADLVRRFSNISSWQGLIRSIAILKKCMKAKKWMHEGLKPTDLEEAEAFIVKTVQTELYPKGDKERALTKLHPYLDEEEVIRIGGRVRKAEGLTDLEKHPAIIPKNCHISRLIIRHYHEQVHHLGRRSTQAAIREGGYWLIGSTNQVKSVIGKCMSCLKLRGSAESQLMGDLPEERVTQTPPFTHIGIDVFGPFHIKDRRTELKRWGLIISCLYSRAIHIEVLENMDINSMIQALRCFMSLRGKVKTIICDNGTNFVGTRNEWDKQLDMADVDMKQYLLQNRIEFRFNSPGASHQGGATERMIRSVRSVLNAIFAKHKRGFDTQTLRTVFYEAANIVNNRPLTATSTTNPEEAIITPNRLLTMKPNALPTPPPGDFTEEDIYSTKRWKVTQRLAQEFWNAWKTDYLNSITTRQKWKTAKENLKLGDLVMIKDDGLSRNDWKIGTVSEVLPGKDGFVRNILVELGNRHLDNKGKRLQNPVTLKRPVNKVVVLLRC